MTGLGVLAVGLLLCFAGLYSVHLAVLASGFALGWLVAESLGGSVAVVATVALCAAVVAWVLATLVFRAALLVVGAIAGGVIGAKLFGLLEGDDGNVLLAVLFVLAVAVLTGLAAQRFHETALVWACAFGGAGLALSGAARVWPDTLGFLRTPDTTVEAVVDAAAWIALAAAGWSVQRRWARRKAASRS
jgi:hypothetical protein